MGPWEQRVLAGRYVWARFQDFNISYVFLATDEHGWPQMRFGGANQLCPVCGGEVVGGLGPGKISTFQYFACFFSRRVAETQRFLGSERERFGKILRFQHFTCFFSFNVGVTTRSLMVAVAFGLVKISTFQDFIDNLYSGWLSPCLPWSLVLDEPERIFAGPSIGKKPEGVALACQVQRRGLFMVVPEFWSSLFIDI